jgi:hypothetical protein
MKLVRGIHHKRTLEDLLIRAFQGAIVTLILTIVALVAADAWIKEDIARVEKLKQHFYDIAYSRVEGPKAPAGLKPNYGAPSEPKTRVFADTSVKSEVLTKQAEKRRDGVK